LVGIAIERQQSLDQSLGACRIHGVFRLRAGSHDGRDRAIPLDPRCHALLPSRPLPIRRAAHGVDLQADAEQTALIVRQDPGADG
jgi:hypothetical protein